MTGLTSTCDRCGADSFDNVAGECWNCLHQDGIPVFRLVAGIVLAWVSVVVLAVLVCQGATS